MNQWNQLIRVFHVQGVDRNRSGSDKRPDRLELESSDLDVAEGKEMRPMSQHRYSNRSRKLRRVHPAIFPSLCRFLLLDWDQTPAINV